MGVYLKSLKKKHICTCMYYQLIRIPKKKKWMHVSMKIFQSVRTIDNSKQK